MDLLRIMIVDDEPLAREILEDYISRTPGLQLIASCRNALEAFSVLSRESADVLLLDINMPEINGIEFVRTLKDPPPVIFTTAYSEYAVKSYEYDAIDYLLKPIPFERFLRSIHKLRSARQPREQPDRPGKSLSGQDVIFVRSEGKLIKIDINQVLFVEGLKDYLKLWMPGAKHIVHGTMKHMEEQLGARSHFIRVNKSFIVNMHYILEVEGHTIKLSGHIIPIGATYRDEVHKTFSRYKLL